MAHKKHPVSRWHYKCNDPDMQFRLIKSERDRWIDLVTKKTGLAFDPKSLAAIFEAGLGKFNEPLGTV